MGNPNHLINYRLAKRPYVLGMQIDYLSGELLPNAHTPRHALLLTKMLKKKRAKFKQLVT